jgi:glutathione S-transferase
MITLYQFPRAWNIPNPGQFCVKLETYLRMAGIEYRIAETLPIYAPFGQLPFIEGNGQKLADSRVIIRYLQQHYGDSLDGHLSAEQSAQALAWQRLLEEHLYWVCMYSRWQYGSENWQINKQAIFQGLQQPLADVVAALYRLRVRGQLRGQGIGRATCRTYFRIGPARCSGCVRRASWQNFFVGRPALQRRCLSLRRVDQSVGMPGQFAGQGLCLNAIRVSRLLSAHPGPLFSRAGRTEVWRLMVQRGASGANFFT